MPMNNLMCGDLNKRVTFETVKTVANKASGFNNQVTDSFTVWGRVEATGTQVFWNTSQIGPGVTNRIFVRAVKGKTYPCDFKNVQWASCEGVKYKILRVMDVNGEHRFTLLECCADGVKV